MASNKFALAIPTTRRRHQIKLSDVLTVGSVTVSGDGTGTFKTITEAINFAPSNLGPEDGYFDIHLKKGLYKGQHIIIPSNKTNIYLHGDGISNTIITGNLGATPTRPTIDTATFSVLGSRFVGKDITFRNDFGQGSQAVAVLNTSNQSVFYKCGFKGYQDTLFAEEGSQFYRECDIYGTVDFICGNAAAVFQKCNLLGRAPVNSTTVFSAHRRQNVNERTGYSFDHCTIGAAEHELVPKGSCFLGRPWGPFSRVVCLNCNIGDIISPTGWMDWNNDTARRDTVYYGELNNNGFGSNTSSRVPWRGVHKKMSDVEARLFTVDKFINGSSWLPKTAVPFTPGLASHASSSS